MIFSMYGSPPALPTILNSFFYIKIGGCNKKFYV